MTESYPERAKHEIEHGKMLAMGDTEAIWGWGTPAGQQRSKRRGALLSKAAGLGPGVRTLEVGCGTGMFTEMFTETGAEIVAMDISPALIEKAKTRKLPPEQVQFLCQSFEDVELQGSFDAVIGSSVLHHLEISPALAAIYSLLKPGGIMAFAEPNMLNPQVFAERTFMRRFLYYVSPDEIAFMRCSFKRQLEQAGFDDIEITPFDWLHPAIPETFIDLMSAVGRLLEKIPIVRELSGSLIISCRRPVQ
ncbi:MAG: methyltransferase domain-containing protein [Desulfobacteraceae bacterium]|nr:methyltransferase domain-containing protein [Desulfobacteraceae bacterium]